MITIQWPVLKILDECLESLSYFNSQSALLTIHIDTKKNSSSFVEFQCCCKKQRNLFCRRFVHPHDVKITTDKRKDQQKDQQKDHEREQKDQKDQTYYAVFRPPDIRLGFQIAAQQDNVSTVKIEEATETRETRETMETMETRDTGEETTTKEQGQQGQQEAIETSFSSKALSLSSKKSWSVKWVFDSIQQKLYQEIPEAKRCAWIPVSHLLPSSLFYNVENLFNTKHEYNITTHLAPLLHLDFIELSIFGDYCQMAVLPQKFEFRSCSLPDDYLPSSHIDSIESIESIDTTGAPIRTPTGTPIRQSKEKGEKGEINSVIEHQIHAETISRYRHKQDVMDKISWMRMPEFLSEDLWNRHQYSINDIKKTFEVMPDKIVWQFVVTYNLGVTNAATNVQNDNDTRIQCCTKTNAITKIIKDLAHRHKDWTTRNDVTWEIGACPSGDNTKVKVKDEDDEQKGKKKNATTLPTLFSYHHIPNLPVHRLNATEYQQLQSKVHVFSSSIFRWRGIDAYVTDYHPQRNLIMMSRIMEKKEYLHKTPQPMNTAETISRLVPREIDIQQTTYIIMDETFYFCSNDDHPNHVHLLKENHPKPVKKRKLK